MRFGRTSQRSRRRGPEVELSGPVNLSIAEERALFAIFDAAVYVAGRTSAMMALRGSRAEKVRRLGVVGGPGHGFYAGRSEAEVMAKIDTCFHRGWLRLERTREGLPLLAYTDTGLAKAQGYVIDTWLEELRGQIEGVARGEPLRLSLVMAVNPQRNQDTALQLVDEVERVADASWLPVLRAWGAVETKRVRARLWGVIERLEDAS